MEDKIGIIIGGGGMNSVFAAGVISALARELRFLNPDVVIAGSGGAVTAAYYTAKQYDAIYNVWTNLLSTKKLIHHFRFWKILDVDYLIDVILKQLEPLNCAAIKKSKICLLIPITNVKDREVHYFSNKDNVDVFELLRATKALPIFYGKKIKINNQNYCDGLSSSLAEYHLSKAIELGCNKIILINNKPPWFGSWFAHIVGLIKGEEYKNKYLNRDFLFARAQNSGQVKIYKIESPEDVESRPLNNNKVFLLNVFQRGYNMCKQDDKLKRFLI